MPLVRGVFYTRSTPWGAVAQSWPTNRKKTTDRQSQWWRDLFAIAAQMAANPESLDYQTAVEMVKGTEMVPRDWLMKCCYGTAYEVVLPDGTTMEASYKGPPELEPGPGPGPEPEPEEPEMAWQWSMWDKAMTAGLSALPEATKGTIFVPKIAAKCKAIRVVFNQVSGYTYRVTLANMETASKLGATIVSADFTSTLTGRQVFEMPAVVDLAVDTPYCVIVTATSQPGTYALPITFDMQPGWLWPVKVQSGARLASNNPQPGDTLIVSTVATIPIGLLVDV